MSRGLSPADSIFTAYSSVRCARLDVRWLLSLFQIKATATECIDHATVADGRIVTPVGPVTGRYMVNARFDIPK